MFVIPMGDGRQFVSASDEEHPLLKTLPSVQTYPVDMRWRVAARFDAFDAPKMMPVADVRGGSAEYPAVGHLTFRIGDREQRLVGVGVSRQRRLLRDVQGRDECHDDLRVPHVACAASSPKASGR